MATKKMGPVGAFFFGGIMTLVSGVVGVFFGLPKVTQARESEEWPTVSGVITVSEVGSKRNSDGDTMYRAKVRYSYSVDGQDLDSNRVWFGGKGFSSSNRGTAEKVVATYSVGESVDVYYDQSEPSTSVLQPGAFMSTYLILGFCVLFFLVGLALFGGSLMKLVFGAGLIAVLLGSMMRKKPAEVGGGFAVDDGSESGFALDDGAGSGFAVDEGASSGFAVDESIAAAPVSDRIELDCPHCGHGLRISRKYAGQVGKCKHCQQEVSVPGVYLPNNHPH